MYHQWWFSAPVRIRKRDQEFGAKEFWLVDEVEKLEKPVQVLVVAGNKYPSREKYVLTRFSISEPKLIISKVSGEECVGKGWHYCSSIRSLRTNFITVSLY